MDLQESFSKIVSGLVVNNQVQLSEKEILQAAELLVRKALIKLSLLEVGDSASVTVNLKGITGTKHEESKESIYAEALEIINNDGNFKAQVRMVYLKGESFSPKIRLVVRYKELLEE